MLKKFLIGTFVLVAFAVTANLASAYDFGTTTLKVGSKGPAVVEVQTLVGATADGVFGPMTAAKVKVWQAANGLTADGVFGAMSKAKANATVSTTLPAGCTSTAGYSSTTGVKCDSTVSTTLPAGCTSTAGYSSTTGAKCDGVSPVGDTGPLAGGAGEFIFSTTTSNTESTIKEGTTEKVVAFKAEADGSDMALTSVKVILKNNDFAATSEKLGDYVDEVSVYMGDTKIGSADVSEFSKDAGSPDTYTKSISLSNGIVRENVKATFYVALTANSSIDTTDMATADWNVEVDTVRYTDATGLTSSESLGYNATLTNGFKDASTDDDMSIKSSQNNPLAKTLKVEANKNSDEYLVGAFKLDVDDQSDDVSVTSLSVRLTINDSSNTGTSDDAAAMIDSVSVEINGEDYTADLQDEEDDSVVSDTTCDAGEGCIDNGDGTGVYLVEFDPGDVKVDSGDDTEVKVSATFNDQSGNYGAGTTVYASVVASTDIDAETTNDDVAVTGTFTGKTHTLALDAPTFELVGTPTLAVYQAIDGITTGLEDIFLAKFVFNVTAGDDDVYLSKGVEGDANYTDYVSFTRTGAGTIDSQILEAEDTTLDDGLTSSFLVSAGNTEKFTLSFFVRGNNTSEKFTVDGFSYGTADDTATAYVYASDVTSGLSAFTTPSVYLAK